MLILSRRVGETLVITTEDGQQIRVTILRTRDNQVRVGIAAPKSVTVLREELVERQATGTEPDA